MRTHRQRSGVTVIELVVVVALIGIMAGAVAPSFGSLDRRPEDRSVTERIDALVRFGRNVAVERAESVEITIDPRTNRFWVDPPDTTGILDVPDGTTLISRQARVHVHIEPNGEATIDERLFVGQGDKPLLVGVGR